MSDVRQYFDRGADEFAANYGRADDFAERVRVWRRAIDAALDSLGYAPCLDAGCGEGTLGRIVAARGVPTLGIDQSEAMLALAVRRAQAANLGNARFERETVPLSGEFLSRHREAFGLIVCSSVLEYVADWQRALQQFGAMLRIGGELILSVPNRRSIYRLGERLWRPFVRESSYLRYQQHQFDPNALCDHLRTLGFDIVHAEYFALPWQHFTARLCGAQRSSRLATLYLVRARKRGKPAS